MTPYQQAIAQLNQKYSGTTTTSAPPKQNIVQKATGFIGNVAKDALNTLVVTPATRIAQAGLAVARPFTSPKTQQKIDTALATPQTNLGVTVPPQKSGMAGIEQIGGQALKAGSYLYGGQGLGGLAEGGIKQGIIQGAKIGGIAGAGGQAGNIMEQGGNLGQVAGGALQGGAVGALTGGVLGGATAAIHPIFTRSTPILDPNTVTSPKVTEAQTQFNTANQNYATADVGLQQATNIANQTIQSDIGKGGSLGQEFAAKIEKTPGESSLTNTQLESLQRLKEGKTYQTPDFIEKAAGTQATMGGRALNPENPAIKAQIEKAIGQSAGETGLKINSKQASEIMRGLNESTYKVADGQKIIDQSRIGVTKELEQQFAKDFGPQWQQAYSDFKAGVQFRNTFEGIINFDKNAPTLDLIKQTDALQKALQTPGGEYQVQKAIDEFAKIRGEDKASVLEDLITKTKEVGRQQEIFKTAQTNLDLAVKMAEKGGYGKQFIKAMKNPSLAARRLIGPVIAIPATILLLPYLRKLYKSITGQ